MSYPQSRSINTGTAWLGIGLFNVDALAATAIYLLGHAVAQALLFFGTGILLNRFETVDEHRLFGRGRPMPLTGFGFVVAALGLAGLPPIGVWAGKSLLEHSALTSGHAWLIVVMTATSALTGGAVLRVALRVFLGSGPRPSDADRSHHEEAETRTPLRRLNPALHVPGIIMLIATVVIGISASFRHAITAAATVFLDTLGYRTDVLAQGVVSPRSVPATANPSDAIGLVTGLAGVLFAVAIAIIGVAGTRLPRRIADPFVRPAHRLMAVLHHIHAPHIGDQIAWLVLGTAIVTLTLVTIPP